MENKFCYKCGNIATTREHVPPICLFPEAKDVLGLNFRKDLITVPSCDEHNSNKSHDDEFLMVSIAGIVGNNLVGYLQTQTKVDRAIRRKSKDFLNKEIIKNYKHQTLKSKNGKKYPVLYGNPNYNRLLNCFEHISYGVYFHEFGERFEGVVKMLLGFINYDDNNTQTMTEMVKEKFIINEIAKELKGKNPTVFKYQFFEPDQFGLIGLVMTFYEGTEVFVAFQPINSKEPFDLSMSLLNAGIPTFIEVGNKIFEFNKK
ncbi:hypothetical protein [Flavobacterium geliluteum]|uniref:HNH endonuclease n=1 Tax=Flavobacterium geliluteum TaxID=2816120 RepID=A0A940X666_9FLAO|nr:hypothetical protein [Flavobacterium geliluteum]MBP4138693.1 hypothetical protein [Flavobacterium geliluteum]